MPNRVIREGFLDSPRIDQLDWFAECVYHRLLLAVDDAGRIDGRSSVLKSRLFPLKDRLRASDVERVVHQLEEAGLVVCWEVGTQKVIQVTRWRRCGNSQFSRYPDPSGSYEIRYEMVQTRDGPCQMVASSLTPLSHLDNPRSHPDPIPIPSASHRHPIPNTKTETKTKTKTLIDCSETNQVRSEPPATGPPSAAALETGPAAPNADEKAFETWWTYYPRKVGKQAARRAYHRARQQVCKETGCTPAEARQRLLEAVQQFARSPKAKGDYCPHAATWLNQGRYDDDPAEWRRPDHGRNAPTRIRRAGRYDQPQLLAGSAPEAAASGPPLPPPFTLRTSVGADSEGGAGGDH